MELPARIKEYFVVSMVIILFSFVIYGLLYEFSDVGAGGPFSGIFSLVAQVTGVAFSILTSPYTIALAIIALILVPLASIDSGR